jgi:surfeit locus 1 family protein
MSRRTLLFAVLAGLAALVCVRLGFWQLSRLRQRRAHNALVEARLSASAEPLRAVPADTAKARFRRVRVAGRLDYPREIVLTGRSRRGSPGVNILTPVHLAGTDTLVLVNRGWVYSPDAAEIDHTRWREGDSLDADGWVEIPSREPGAAVLRSRARAYRWLDRSAVEGALGAPIAPFYVVLDSAPADTGRDHPVRLQPPALDEGPHRSYAIQWFFFALMSVVGAATFVRSQRRRA